MTRRSKKYFIIKKRGYRVRTFKMAGYTFDVMVHPMDTISNAKPNWGIMIPVGAHKSAPKKKWTKKEIVKIFTRRNGKWVFNPKII